MNKTYEYNTYNEVYADVYSIEDKLIENGYKDYSDKVNKALNYGYSASEIFPPLFFALREIPKEVIVEIELEEKYNKLLRYFNSINL